jgi:hypothetical protein
MTYTNPISETRWQRLETQSEGWKECAKVSYTFPPFIPLENAVHYMFLEVLSPGALSFDVPRLGARPSQMEPSCDSILRHLKPEAAVHLNTTDSDATTLDDGVLCWR